MFDNNIDTLLVLSQVNRFYFSKVETSFGCVILHEDKKLFLTDFRYYSYVLKELSDWEVILTTGDNFYEDISSELTRINAECVGFEDRSLSVDEFGRLKSACSAFHFEPASAYIAAKRAIKTEEEIQKIAAAQFAAQKALSKVIPLIKPGITEKEVAANLVYEMQMLGAEGASFETIVAFADGSAVPHHKTSKRKLEKNDIVLIDMGARLDGYCSDMTRTFCVGTPKEELIKIHKIVLEAQEYALANIKAGITGHEADSYAREYITSHGYGKQFGHSLGHGVGLEIHEFPRLKQMSDVVLEPNMIVTIEPGIYVDGLGGVRIEDLAIVKEDGLLNLTNFDKNINL